MPATMYAIRRARIAKTIGKGAHLLLCGATKLLRNDDVHFPFRQESNFFYLTGFDEPDAMLLIIGGDEPHSTLFCAPKDKVVELWEGERIGPKKALRNFGFDEALPNTNKVLSERLLDAEKTSAPFTGDIDALIGEMRIIKDAGEIATMRTAAAISARAHRDVLSFVYSDMYEHEIEAALAFHFRKAGGDALHAYPMIVASGKNALTLHYTKNSSRTKSGDLLLIDAGCEYDKYASDITRTIPVSGVFTKAQRTLYKIVLRAQIEAISVIAPDIPIERVHYRACRVITEGLLDIGLIKAASLDAALLEKRYKPFFPHGTSHWLGMDVHDAGDYCVDPETKAKMRLLEPGMVLTVEPGIYVRPSRDIPKEYWNIGIRIEDDVLVTDSGREVLSHLAPKDPDEIESLIASSNHQWW